MAVVRCEWPRTLARMDEALKILNAILPNLYHERTMILQQNHRRSRPIHSFSTAAARPLLADRSLFLLQAARRHTLTHHARRLGSSGKHS
ncbi:hypothetical protein B0T48_21070 [Chromobacterium violaceum]|nr:hypothetical protein B0T48_21070 [Chromobacterium violaceum]